MTFNSFPSILNIIRLYCVAVLVDKVDQCPFDQSASALTLHSPGVRNITQTERQMRHSLKPAIHSMAGLKIEHTLLYKGFMKIVFSKYLHHFTVRYTPRQMPTLNVISPNLNIKLLTCKYYFFNSNLPTTELCCRLYHHPAQLKK